MDSDFCLCFPAMQWCFRFSTMVFRQHLRSFQHSKVVNYVRCEQWLNQNQLSMQPVWRRSVLFAWRWHAWQHFYRLGASTRTDMADTNQNVATLVHFGCAKCSTMDAKCAAIKIVLESQVSACYKWSRARYGRDRPSIRQLMLFIFFCYFSWCLHLWHFGLDKLRLFCHLLYSINYPNCNDYITGQGGDAIQTIDQSQVYLGHFSWYVISNRWIS